MGSRGAQPWHELRPAWPQRSPAEHVDPPPRTIRLRVLETILNELTPPGAGLFAARESPQREWESRESDAARLRAAARPPRTASLPSFPPSSRGLGIWIPRGRQQPRTVTVSMPAPSTSSSSASAPTSSCQPSSTASSTSLPGPSPPADPTPSSSSAFPRRVKSKGSLRSTTSSHRDDDKNHGQSGGDHHLSLLVPHASVLRRLSPGLAARVKLLDGSARATLHINRPQNVVGKIPEHQIKELESVEKRGRAWTGKRSTQANPPSSQQQQQQQITKEEEQLQTPVESVGELPDPAAADVGRTVSADPDPEPVVSDDVQLSTTDDNHHRDKDDDDDAAATAMSVAEPVVAPGRPSSGSNGVDSQRDQSDFEKYLKSSAEKEEKEENGDQPPPPPPKDSPPAPSSASSSYFNPLGLHRTESIYSFSRASFSSQLSQLTSITLPQPSSLEASIAAIPTAPAAVKALTGAAEQIRIWINKASDVLGGLDAEDDIEWAAAAGREGLDDVDRAIKTFESLISVYVKAIENVQLREDISSVSGDTLKEIVVQVESILKDWAKVKSQLKGVKEQVELAMEWEELWSNVLGDVGLEVDSLSRLIFEMEEKRHKTMTAEPGSEHTPGLDINELETIVEESPGPDRTNQRFSFPAFTETPPTSHKTPQDDLNSSLMALFARMQPLRASLDFLPMRLSMFQSRAEKIFPSACEELEERRNRLEKGYKKLEADAEALRKELSEDKWILVFRNAGRQAEKMFDSVERSIGKLQEALDTGAHIHNQAALAKRIESFEAKKMHYTPAIERVVSIIQKGVNDRLTVNGEILRLLSDMESRLDALKASLKVMDSVLEDLNLTASQQLRDSISSIMTMDSPATGSAIDTPGSSPASSVILSSGSGVKGASTPSRRGSSVGSTVAASKARRYSSLPQPVSTRKSSIPRSAASSTVTSPTRSQGNSSLAPTPSSRVPARRPSPAPPINNRPRWNSSTNTSDLDVGHNFKPLSATTPSPYRKDPVPTHPPRRSSSSTLAPPSPLGRQASASPAPGRRSSSRATSRLASPTPNRLTATPTPTGSVLDPPPYSKLRRQPSAMDLPSGRRNRQSYAGISVTRTRASDDHDASSPARPGTALGHSNNNNHNSRRSSMLPVPKARSGRESSTSSRSRLDERPPWRY